MKSLLALLALALTLGGLPVDRQATYAQAAPSEANHLRTTSAASGPWDAVEPEPLASTPPLTPGAPLIPTDLPSPPAESAAADSDESETSDKPADVLQPQPPQIKSDLETRLKAVENAAISEDDRRKAVEYYQQAIGSFDVANQQIEAAIKFQKDLDLTKFGLRDPDPTKNGKYSLQDYTERLAKPLPPYEEVVGEPLEKVEGRAVRVEAELTKYRQDLAEMIEAPKLRSQRMAELPKQVAEIQQKLKQTIDELASVGSEDMTDVLTVARRAQLTQNRAAHEATLYALKAEQQYYEQSAEWVKVRRDYFARYVPHKEKRLAQLREQINQRRELAAKQQALQAAQTVQDVKDSEGGRPQAISELANRNKVLAEERAKLVASITVISKQFDDASEQLLRLTEQYNRAKEQDKVDELSHLNGQLLREQQSKLPDLRAIRRRHAQRDSERAEILLRLYHLNDDASALANIEERADSLATQAGDLSEATRAEFRQLLTAQRDIVEAYIKNCDDYSKGLAKLESVESQLIGETDSYAAFIAQRVLWIGSCQMISPRDWPPASDAFAWSLDPRNWRDAGAAILRAGNRKPARFAACTLALVVLAACQGAARRRLRQLGGEAEKRSCTRLKPTLDALWLTVIIALPWPALLAFMSWSMDSLNESEFVRSLSISLRFTALCLLVLELTRHLCRLGGLADCHFDWPEACLAQIRRKLRWLTVLGLPLVLWLSGLEVQEREPLWSSSLGRVCFITLMLLLASLLYSLLMSRNTPFRQLVLVSGGGWLTPLQLAWRPAVVIVPAALAILAAAGYYFTSQQAALRLLETGAMLLCVMTLGGVTRRWLLMNRRRLAREQAKQRRAQLAAAAEADSTAPLQPELADEAIDLAAISEQTQKLVRTFLAITTAVGLVLIWNEILPALKYPAARTLPWAVELTWGHLAAFFIVLGVTYVSVRDVPALLELVVLQHLPLDSGSRYAVTSISRYVLTAIGLTAAFNVLGGDWNKIQWLVAAMSVGLGFGLQEIFANFVSGIILLFERPIRVGDIVTLGDKSGVVNRIRMRATTIVDWDRKEYIVPNKDLVTGRLLNWTLSDQMNRIEIIVNVAHGADTDAGCALLLEAAREQPHVLAEPSPSAVFEGLSEAGLKLALRCFLPTLEHRGATIHQLYTTIDRKFRAANIELAAPPREMRLRLTDDGSHTLPAKHSAA